MQAFRFRPLLAGEASLAHHYKLLSSYAVTFLPLGQQSRAEVVADQFFWAKFQNHYAKV